MDGVFAITGLLALCAVWVVRTQVPDPASVVAEPDLPGAASRAGATGVELARLNVGIFVLHIVLYAMFVVLPPLIVAEGLALSRHWSLYLPVVLASFALMVPAVIYADRRNRPKPVLLASVVLLLAVEAALAVFAGGSGIAALAAMLLLFFVAFNVLEAMLPALVSRFAPARRRGAAIGVYNTTQTLGVFFGGLLGGALAQHFGAGAVFATCAVLCVVWLAAAAGMQPSPRPVNDLSSLTFSIAAGVDLDVLRAALLAERGVREAVVLADERIAHLKVVPGQCDESRLRKLVMGEN
jgi:MFS family permease